MFKFVKLYWGIDAVKIQFPKEDYDENLNMFLLHFKAMAASYYAFNSPDPEFKNQDNGERASNNNLRLSFHEKKDIRSIFISFLDSLVAIFPGSKVVSNTLSFVHNL